MGQFVNRPLREGVGEKPTTQKPKPEEYLAIHTFRGQQPITLKPRQTADGIRQADAPDEVKRKE